MTVSLYGRGEGRKQDCTAAGVSHRDDSSALHYSAEIGGCIVLQDVLFADRFCLINMWLLLHTLVS